MDDLIIDNNIKSSSHLLQSLQMDPFSIEYSEPKTCPKCNSVHLTTSECESCGFQINSDLLGAPLDEKSFYSLRENYWGEFNLLERGHDSLEGFARKNKVRSYKRQLLNRYNILLKYFYSDADTSKDRPFFMTELTDLIIELVKYDVSEDLIWQRVNEVEIDPENVSFYNSILAAINDAKTLKEDKTNIILAIMNYKVFGVFALGPTVVTVLTFWVVILGSILLFRNLLDN